MKKQDNQYLTVGQLKKILDECVNVTNENNLVVISSEPLSGRAFIGSSPCMTCNSVGFGFDWDSGRFFIFPSEKLYFKDKEKL